MTSPPSDDSVDLPEPGELIAGKYRIERLVGSGGMGAVFAAVHEQLHVRVAMKFLRPEGAAHAMTVSRFMNEARSAARFQGKHFARVMDIDQLPSGIPYMVLEYLEGQDFDALLEQGGPFPIVEAVDLVMEALEALAEAHAARIVHRDLKPANLFLARQSDGTNVVKVLDFGISKALDAGFSSQLAPVSPSSSPPLRTATNAMVGTPYYMAPERLRNSKVTDPRSDLWAMGVILYEMVGGQRPFSGDSLGELLIAILEQDPIPLGQLRSDVPPLLERVVARCLERSLDLRVGTVAELADALAPLGSARAVASAERIRRFQPQGPPRASLAGPRTVEADWAAQVEERIQEVRERHSSAGLVNDGGVPPTEREGRPTFESSPPDEESVAPRLPAGATTTSGLATHPNTSPPVFSSQVVTPVSRRRRVVGPALWVAVAAFLVGVGAVALGGRAETAPLGVQSGAPALPLDAGGEQDPRPTTVAPPKAAEESAGTTPADKGAEGTVVPEGTSVVRPETTPPRPRAPQAEELKASPQREVRERKPAERSGSAASPTAPAKAPRSGRNPCNPNYWVDEHGEKHFKPECFGQGR